MYILIFSYSMYIKNVLNAFTKDNFYFSIIIIVGVNNKYKCICKYNFN